MEIKEIQKLLDFIANSGLDEVSIETNDGLIVKVKRHSTAAVVEPPQVVSSVVSAAHPLSATPTPPNIEAEDPAAENTADKSKIVTIKPPMIGTYYHASSPESPAFV